MKLLVGLRNEDQFQFSFTIFRYGTSTMRYDNVRGEARGPFVSYPILEDRSTLNNLPSPGSNKQTNNLQSSASQKPKRPTELPLHNSPLI